jgi:hypothetical protein
LPDCKPGWAIMRNWKAFGRRHSCSNWRTISVLRTG